MQCGKAKHTHRTQSTGHVNSTRSDVDTTATHMHWYGSRKADRLDWDRQCIDTTWQRTVASAPTHTLLNC
jgi:hypothetical protein